MDTKQKNRPEQPRKRAAEPRTGKAPAGSKATQKSRRQMPQAEPRRQRVQQPLQRTEHETHNMVQQKA